MKGMYRSLKKKDVTREWITEISKERSTAPSSERTVTVTKVGAASGPVGSGPPEPSRLGAVHRTDRPSPSKLPVDALHS